MNIMWEKAVAAVLSVSSLVCSSLFCVNYGDDLLKYTADISSLAQTHEESQPEEDAPSREVAATSSERASSVSSAPAESESEDAESRDTVSSKVEAALAAAKTGKKLGNITPQFFSPYTTANLKKGKVYVNNRTGLELDIKSLLNSFSLRVSTEENSPQVLIVHTHATENYAARDTYYTKEDMARTGDEGRNVIGVGNQVEKVLKKAGISVIHDKTLHDSPSYSGSYTRSYNTVEKYLEEYPDIKVVLDIHRDAIGDGDDLVKPVTEIKGKKAAQVMICVGSNTGSVDYFPGWEKNLSFGMKLQETLETLYPGLARALYVAYDRCWNQNLSEGSIIIEFGTNGNTMEEAEYSATLVGNALVATLK